MPRAKASAIEQFIFDYLRFLERAPCKLKERNDVDLFHAQLLSVKHMTYSVANTRASPLKSGSISSREREASTPAYLGQPLQGFGESALNFERCNTDLVGARFPHEASVLHHGFDRPQSVVTRKRKDHRNNIAVFLAKLSSDSHLLEQKIPHADLRSDSPLSTACLESFPQLALNLGPRYHCTCFRIEER